MSLVVKDVDTLTFVIQEKILKSIQANTDYLEATLKEAAEDTKTRFELMETQLKMTELDLNIKFNMKIEKAEGNLTLRIDENSTRLTTVEETLASLLKAEKEQNATNKALTDFLVSNFWPIKKLLPLFEVRLLLHPSFTPRLSVDQ
ncbi:hypothetical protein Dimus_024531, partial [Dionaea muscipula]